jgi:peptide/nickel transport system permease protein
VSRGGLIRYFLRRFAMAVPLLLIISFGVFALIHAAPGDPVRALLGTRPARPETIAAIRERFNLDDPFLVQYGKWLWRVLHGDLGRAIRGDQLITRAIGNRGSPLTGGSRPTWMWRPRRRRLRIASAQVCSLPTASTAT